MGNPYDNVGSCSVVFSAMSDVTGDVTNVCVDVTGVVSGLEVVMWVLLVFGMLVMSRALMMLEVKVMRYIKSVTVSVEGDGSTDLHLPFDLCCC